MPSDINSKSFLPHHSAHEHTQDFAQKPTRSSPKLGANELSESLIDKSTKQSGSPAANFNFQSTKKHSTPSLPPPKTLGSGQNDLEKKKLLSKIEVALPTTDHDKSELKDALVLYHHAIKSFSNKEPVDSPEPRVFGPSVSSVSPSLQKANFILAAIHDETSNGSWDFADQVSTSIKALQDKIGSRKTYRATELSDSFISSLKSELHGAQEKLDFLHQTRSCLITLRSNWAGQKAMTGLQQTATRHLSLSIISKAQLGQSVVVPLDFISKDGVGNHATLLAIEPELTKKSTMHAENIKINIYETNGDISEKIIPYKEWSEKVKEKRTKFMQNKMFADKKIDLNVNHFATPRAKAFTKTEITAKITQAGESKSPEEKKALPPIVADLARWMTLDYPPNSQGVVEQINNLREELRTLYDLKIPDQELQSIQRHGVCELKSIYSYLKRNLSPIAYALIRREVISSSRDTLKSTINEKSTQDIVDVTSKVVREAAATRVQKSEKNSTSNFHKAILEELIEQADSKLSRANTRLSEYIDAHLITTT